MKNIHRFPLSIEYRILCQVIGSNEESGRDAANELEVKLGLEVAFRLAEKNQVETIFVHRLGKKEGTKECQDSCLSSHETKKNRLLQFFNEVDRIAETLQEQRIPIILLKNGGIARGIYPCPGCCPMGDLDTLIEKRHFRRAHEILLQAGFHFEFRASIEADSLDEAEQSGGAEYWKILPNGEKFWLELQWRPVAGRWIRPDQEPSAEELMARSLPIPGTAVRLLSPEDNLLQVCLHTAKHSYVRAPGFRLHLDVDRIVHYQQVDWDVFLQRVIHYKVKTPVYFSLAIPADLFETPIPERALSALRPPAWKERWITAWLNRVGLFNPDEPKFSRLGYILFTALLYDDFSGLWRSVVPDKAWMRQRYNIQNDLFLPVYHLRRWFDLAFRRLKT